MRYRLGQELAESCPLECGREIVLTGSVSRGIADEHSDIELGFLVDTLPPASRRARWLRDSGIPRWLQEVGATDIVLDDDPIEDGSIWATFRFRDVWIEAAWQAIPSNERLLRAIAAAKVTDHDRLRVAWIIARALPLRTIGLLTKWQRLLTSYPDLLQRKLIAGTAAMWAVPHAVRGPSRWGVRAGDRLPFVTRLVWDVHRVLRVLFAINRKWEPDWKWIRSITDELPVKPDRLVERIDSILSGSDPSQSRHACNLLILDTLALVPPEHDISRAYALIQETVAGMAGATAPGGHADG